MRRVLLALATVEILVFACPAIARAATPQLLPALNGPLQITNGVVSGWYSLTPDSVSLVDITGRPNWTAAVKSAETPQLVAEGDFTGDGAPDAVFTTLEPIPGRTCGSHPMDSSALVFIDGKSGKTWQPLPPLEDICWSFGSVPPYPTHQWELGSVYIGRLHGDTVAVAAFPYYATEGWVVHHSVDGSWTRDTSPLVFPSTDQYDRVYNAANQTRCSIPYAGGSCHVTHSHVPNAVFLDNELFVLTSARAFIYRNDGTPSSDLTWISGGRIDNAGRNYGLVTSLMTGVDLIGGCTVGNTRALMRTGATGNPQCSLHHHYEWFGFGHAQLVSHTARYYGNWGTDGDWEGRIEYPMRANAPLAGSPSVVFNLFRSGAWHTVVLNDPSRPDNAVEVGGWYTWDTIQLGDGSTGVLASRVPGSAAGEAARAPDWSFDLLVWDGHGFTSLGHFAGVVPSLLPYPPMASVHASDVLPAGTYSVRQGWRVSLLVEDRNGSRRMLDLPNR